MFAQHFCEEGKNLTKVSKKCSMVTYYVVRHVMSDDFLSDFFHPDFIGFSCKSFFLTRHLQYLLVGIGGVKIQVGKQKGKVKEKALSRESCSQYPKVESCI